MASSSTSSIHKRSFKYDVFLSFRGEDPRINFGNYLYWFFLQQNIETYKDDKYCLEKGTKINTELIHAIENSRLHVIVFSKNYASSSWCLDELVRIIERKKTGEQTVFPIYYDVEPSEVQTQSGQFGQAFAKHEKEEDVGKWREALKEAVSLAGWNLNDRINFSVDEKLIGMEARIGDVVSSLEIGADDDVRMMGIKGIGGGGKTTLARAVFDQVSFQFEGSSFVKNVREKSNPNFSGLKKLQKQILKDVLKDRGIEMSNVDEGRKMMKKMMRGRKVLVVVDDVDHIDQLKALVGDLNWFKKGSRIILTTRDEQVLVAHGVNLIHAINLLSREEAICLFSRYAFGTESPIHGYKELSEQVVDYAAGLPLTIRVLGLFLYGKNELEWEDAIEKLKTIPLKETLEILELSYIGLEEDCKDIFLDVACILKGWEEEEAIKVLESCGFQARNALNVLAQRSLMTTSEYGYLRMHDHIEEMARYIVRRQHPKEPNKHSRLWIEEETKYILANNLGTEATSCINLIASEINRETVMKGLGNMTKLRVLVVHGNDSNSDWEFDEVSQYFPNSLQYLSWGNYPFLSFPKTFQANNLVALRMHRSRIVGLWQGGERKDLEKLRYLDLNSSMLKALDLGRSLNLEKVNLARCHDLIKLQMPLTECRFLTTLNLSHSKLKALDLGRTPNLQILNLGNCNELVELHVPVGGLKSLATLWLSGCFSFTKFSFKKKSGSLDLGYREGGSSMELSLSAEFLMDISPLHSDKNIPRFQFTCFFEELEYPSVENLENNSVGLCACTNLKSIAQRICGLQCVTKLTLSGSIQEAPKDLGRLECLEELNFSLTNITHLPYSICMLKHLKVLSLADCELLEKLPEDLDRLECVEILCLWRCVNLRDIPKSICMMKRLKRFDLNGCILVKKLPEELGCIACLQELYIEDTGISDLPLSIVLLEGLHIKGSGLLHQSCTPTFDTEDSDYNTFYHKGTRSRSLLHDPDF
ncbi:hypothetical protein OSB04_016458 [Centaurea solstitialis]|uniref:TIR domain-containing protein n=1 Tax=Centaurea solstitialis TaxID=347529 RepID=A0AA38TL03_9ASTR|nr:hypothetical protein OSB04_016458 [Centaurea solstitialis]